MTPQAHERARGQDQGAAPVGDHRLRAHEVDASQPPAGRRDERRDRVHSGAACRSLGAVAYDPQHAAAEGDRAGARADANGVAGPQRPRVVGRNDSWATYVAGLPRQPDELPGRGDRGRTCSGARSRRRVPDSRSGDSRPAAGETRRAARGRPFARPIGRITLRVIVTGTLTAVGARRRAEQQLALVAWPGPCRPWCRSTCSVTGVFAGTGPLGTPVTVRSLPWTMSSPSVKSRAPRDLEAVHPDLVVAVRRADQVDLLVRAGAGRSTRRRSRRRELAVVVRVVEHVQVDVVRPDAERERRARRVRQRHVLLHARRARVVRVVLLGLAGDRPSAG